MTKKATECLLYPYRERMEKKVELMIGRRLKMRQMSGGREGLVTS
jgi:hypothetical protein